MPATNPTVTGTKPAASRAGRRFGIGLFSLVVGGVTATFSIQIIRDAFSPAVSSPLAPPPVLSKELPCAEAAEQLWSALQRARRSAADEASEKTALAVFRRELEPEWARLPQARQVCELDAEGARGLAALVSLRFEEEHAVRFEARGLAQTRHRVQTWVQGLTPQAGAGTGRR
jgi:hypothetical protein